MTVRSKAKIAEPARHETAQPRAFPRSLLAVAAALLLAGCAQAGSSSFPPFRSVGWFAYLNGDDIRQSCKPGARDRYRLVYNAIWGEQVRDYEIIDEPGAGPLLSTRVLFPETLNLDEIGLSDPLRGYRGRLSTIALSPADLGEVVGQLQQSGFEAPVPSGLVLPSDGFYWVVAACRGGAFQFNAYAYPSARFVAITFDRWLFAHDGSGVAVNPPRPSAPRPPSNRVNVEGRIYSIFDLAVGEDGLIGVP